MLDIHQFVYLNVRTPPGTPSIDGSPAETLIRGAGFCDPAVMAFIRLLESVGVPGRVRMLFRADGVSPHTVAEALVDGQWRVFDVLYGFVPRLARGEIATVDELATDPSLLANSRTEAEWYANSQVFLTRGMTGGVAGSLLAAFNRVVASTPSWLIDRVQDLYLLLPQDNQGGEVPFSLDTSTEAGYLFFKARNYHLFFRTAEAARTYREVADRYPESSQADDALYSLGLLQLSQRDDPEAALETFGRLLHDYPETPWAGEVDYLKARAFERLGDCQAARALYERISQGWDNARDDARSRLARLECQSAAAPFPA